MASIMARICIIDIKNMDIGVKILFPEADYCIIGYDEELQSAKREACQRLNITPIVLYDDVYLGEYDIVYIIAPLLDLTEKRKMLTQASIDYNNVWLSLLNVFKNGNVIIKTGGKCKIIDNYDYNYCPVMDITGVMMPSDVAGSFETTFYKRNMSLSKKAAQQYSPLVKPFPYIIFGYQSVIDVLMGGYDNTISNIPHKERQNRIMFYGNIFNHIDTDNNVFINRKDMINQIYNSLHHNFGPTFFDLKYAYLPFAQYLHHLSTFKFGLDVLGVGEPNKRTFEIIAANTLLISQKGDVDWGFEDGDAFSEETIFATADELAIKLKLLSMDDVLYTKCHNNQMYLRRKYMTQEALRQRLLQ
jgi:hypothetical protein